MFLQFGESELPFLVLLLAHIVDDHSFAVLLIKASHVSFVVMVGEHLRSFGAVVERLSDGLAHPIYLFGKLIMGGLKQDHCHPSNSSFFISSAGCSSYSSYYYSSYYSDSTTSPCLPRNHSFPDIFTSAPSFTFTFSTLCLKSNSFFQARKFSGVTGVKAANLGLSKISTVFAMMASSSWVALPSTRYSCIQFLVS